MQSIFSNVKMDFRSSLDVYQINEAINIENVIFTSHTALLWLNIFERVIISSVNLLIMLRLMMWERVKLKRSDLLLVKGI